MSMTLPDAWPDWKRVKLAVIAERVREEAPCADLILLFGSRARGDSVDDFRTGYRSDFDLLVVVEKVEAAEDLATLGERVRELAVRVERACHEGIASIGSPTQGGAEPRGAGAPVPGGEGIGGAPVPGGEGIGGAPVPGGEGIGGTPAPSDSEGSGCLSARGGEGARLVGVAPALHKRARREPGPGGAGFECRF
jgi:predicted nucleotidyltransferase